MPILSYFYAQLCVRSSCTMWWTLNIGHIEQKRITQVTTFNRMWLMSQSYESCSLACISESCLISSFWSPDAALKHFISGVLAFLKMNMKCDNDQVLWVGRNIQLLWMCQKRYTISNGFSSGSPKSANQSVKHYKQEVQEKWHASVKGSVPHNGI